MTTDETKPGSSASRLLRILGLFDAQRPRLEVAEIAGALKCSQATAYRYASDLCDAGLLTRYVSGFMLGPRIIELDYLIREYDPLLTAGLPIVRKLRDDTGCDVMMTEMFVDGVITVHHERGDDPTTVSFSRGRPLPLFKGAGSKAILGSLPIAQQRRLFERFSGQIEAAALGSDWPTFRGNLALMRKAKYAVSLGELDPENVGIGVSLGLIPDLLPASLVMVMSHARWGAGDQTKLIEMLRSAGNAIRNSMRERMG